MPDNIMSENVRKLNESKMKVILQEYPKDQLISMIKNQKIDVALVTTDKKETDLG